MASAGRILLNREVAKKNLSFASVASIDMCWKKFAGYAQKTGCRRLEHVNRQLVLGYGQWLAVEVEQARYSPGYAQRLVSAVNTIMSLSRADWKSVKPVGHCRIQRRSSVRKIVPGGMDLDTISSTCSELINAGLPRVAAGVRLAWSFGLRSKEFALLDARGALLEASKNGQFLLVAGTKGGRSRLVSAALDWQLEALREAAVVQGDATSLIPDGLTWKEFREGPLFDGRPILKGAGIRSYHTLRAAYACRRYREITGKYAPVFAGRVVATEADRSARLAISEELGHNRISVSAAYVGGVYESAG